MSQAVRERITQEELRTRYKFSIVVTGYVADIKYNHDDEVAEPVNETIDDIREIVLKSFKPDLQSGVIIGSSSVQVSDSLC